MKGGICTERYSLEMDFLGAGEVPEELMTRRFGEGGGRKGVPGAEILFMQRTRA